MYDNRMEERKIEVCMESKPPINQNICLTSQMHVAFERAQEALKMAGAINRCLFGENTIKNGDDHSPDCFQEELVMTNNIILAICTELESIMKRLGM